MGTHTTHGTNTWYFGGTNLYFTTTDRTEATPSPMAVYPDDGGIGSLEDDTATAMVYVFFVMRG